MKEKKKRDWSKVNRTCLVCNCKHKQCEMIRWKSGWICEDCFLAETILDEVEDTI